MKVLPVLDLLQGHVVRGVAGQRQHYRPIHSRLVNDSRPTAIATALIAAFACRDLYVADLDALQGGQPCFETYDQLADCGVQLIIDAGLSSSARLERMVEFAHSRRSITGIVVGLESVDGEELLRDSYQSLGDSRAVFSLDLQSGRPLTHVAAWRQASPFDLGTLALGAGFRRLIVLDLAAVGRCQGPTTASLCQQLRRHDSGLEIISGGGVRSVEDIQTLIKAGCDRVLVASALHDGTIGGEPLL